MNFWVEEALFILNLLEVNNIPSGPFFLSRQLTHIAYEIPHSETHYVLELNRVGPTSGPRA